MMDKDILEEAKLHIKIITPKTGADAPLPDWAEVLVIPLISEVERLRSELSIAQHLTKFKFRGEQDENIKKEIESLTKELEEVKRQIADASSIEITDYRVESKLRKQLEAVKKERDELRKVLNELRQRQPSSKIDKIKLLEAENKRLKEACSQHITKKEADEVIENSFNRVMAEIRTLRIEKDEGWLKYNEPNSENIKLSMKIKTLEAENEELKEFLRTKGRRIVKEYKKLEAENAELRETNEALIECHNTSHVDLVINNMKLTKENAELREKVAKTKGMIENGIGWIE